MQNLNNTRVWQNHIIIKNKSLSKTNFYSFSHCFINEFSFQKNFSTKSLENIYKYKIVEKDENKIEIKFITQINPAKDFVDVLLGIDDIAISYNFYSNNELFWLIGGNADYNQNYDFIPPFILYGALYEEMLRNDLKPVTLDSGKKIEIHNDILYCNGLEANQIGFDIIVFRETIDRVTLFERNRSFIDKAYKIKQVEYENFLSIEEKNTLKPKATQPKYPSEQTTSIRSVFILATVIIILVTTMSIIAIKIFNIGG